MTPPDVRDYTAFAAWSAVNCGRLSDAKAEEKMAEAEIARLQVISDAVYSIRDAAQGQANGLQAELTEMRNDFNGDGATQTFNAILDAPPGERSELADARARAGQLLAVLIDAIKHHVTRRYPALDLEAQRANCALLSAVADRHVWIACVAGIERHLAATALVSVEGRVSYTSQGGRVNELRATASFAMGRYGDAASNLTATEKLRESKGY
jgi:hypothetical protein